MNVPEGARAAAAEPARAIERDGACPPPLRLRRASASAEASARRDGAASTRVYRPSGRPWSRR